MSDDLATWLRAQLDEDERVALACRHKSWTHDGGSIVGDHPTDQIVDWVYDEGGWEHIALHDPARVLREVEAARQRIDLAVGLLEDVGNPYSEAVGRRLLMLEALPYADRPGYQEEWRP